MKIKGGLDGGENVVEMDGRKSPPVQEGAEGGRLSSGQGPGWGGQGQGHLGPSPDEHGRSIAGRKCEKLGSSESVTDSLYLLSSEIFETLLVFFGKSREGG